MLWCYTTLPRSWTWRFLRASLGTGPLARKPEFKLPTPVYVRFEKPPIVESSEPVCLSGSAQEFDRAPISCGFLKGYEFYLGGGQALSLQQ